MRNKIKLLAILSLFLLSFFSPLFVSGQETADPIKPSFSWQETTYDYSLYREWSGDSRVINYSDAFSDVFSANLYYYNESEQTITKEIRTHYYNGNYSFFSNKTTKGYIDVNMDLDVYRVDIQYGDAVDLIWMALK